MSLPAKSIEIHGDTVVKTDHPDLMRVEVEKTVRAFALGQDTGLFRVPRVLDYDDAKGQAVFERIHGIRAMRELIALRRADETDVGALGKALAVIHNQLALPKGMEIALPAEFTLPGRSVFLHGDLSVDNVCMGDTSLPIVILDWQMTQVFGGRATYGTPYFDLSFFVSNLFIRPMHVYGWRLSADALAECFLKTYADAMGSFDLEGFRKYVRCFFRRVLLYRKRQLTWKRRLSMIPCQFLFKRWMNSFDW